MHTPGTTPYPLLSLTSNKGNKITPTIPTTTNAAGIDFKLIVKQISNDKNADADSHLTVFILSVFLVRF